jgi:hypothetical protein
VRGRSPQLPEFCWKFRLARPDWFARPFTPSAARAERSVRSWTASAAAARHVFWRTSLIRAAMWTGRSGSRGPPKMTAPWSPVYSGARRTPNHSGGPRWIGNPGSSLTDPHAKGNRDIPHAAELRGVAFFSRFERIARLPNHDGPSLIDGRSPPEMCLIPSLLAVHLVNGPAV